MLIKIYPENPNSKEIDRVVKVLVSDGVVVFPTDSVYAMGCSVKSKKAFDHIIQIKGIREKEATFSLICSNLSHLSDFAKVNNKVFKILKKNLPGPFTFILPASNKVPDKLLDKRKSIGLRIPDNQIVVDILEKLEGPLLSTSIKIKDEIEYLSDPELIYEEYKDRIDICIDGGSGGLEPTTVVDCTTDEIEIIRQGKGMLIY